MPAFILAAALAVGVADGHAVRRSTVRILLAGDVMLGRGVAPLARRDPVAVFAGVRLQIRESDIAIANLESPLTRRPHLDAHGPNALEAPPGFVRILASAGFDALAIANNHAGDAGKATVPDTVRALVSADLAVVGGGRDEAAAFAPRVLVSHGIRVAFLSFDDTGEGPRAGRHSAGVAYWELQRVRRALASARAEADIVVVGLHGGSDYNPTTDPWLDGLARKLARMGADVVWGTGPHVVQPTRTVRGWHGRTAVVTTSLGNLLFDQSIPGTRTGELLEVVAAKDGVKAFRLGATAQQQSNAVDFQHWRLPQGDAATLAGAWWSLLPGGNVVNRVGSAALDRFPGEVVAVSVGDVEQIGSKQLVVSFWRPYRRTAVNDVIPRALLVNSRGLTAHVGLYRRGDRRQLWVAGTVLRPVGRLAACDGGIAVVYTDIEGKAVTGTGAWQWSGFGFSISPSLPRGGRPACADVDHDGLLDPVILGRTR